MQNELKKEQFKLSKTSSVELYVPNEDYFRPNTLSGYLVDNILIPDNATVLEMGAGIGPITILLSQRYPRMKEMFSVEINEGEFLALQKNVQHYGLEAKVIPLLGDLFSPIPQGVRADIILSDASGVDDYWGKNMKTNGIPWYPGPITTGGEDGAEVLCRFSEESPKYCKEDTIVYIGTAPNFSDTERIIETVKRNYKQVELFKQFKVPFNREQMPVLEQTLAEGRHKLYRDIERRGSGGYWTAEIWKATEPINHK